MTKKKVLPQGLHNVGKYIIIEKNLPNEVCNYAA